MPNRLIFFGTEDFSVPFLKFLIEEEYEVAAVVTKPDSARGRSAKLIKPAVKQLAEDSAIPVLQPSKLEDILPKIQSLGVDAGLLAAYGQLIPDVILGAFNAGIINVHPSDLPKHRGPSPIEQSILDGDKKTAVSLIRLISAMDAGPIYAKVGLGVPSKVSKKKLTAMLADAGLELVRDKLPLILDGRLAPEPQDESKATYTKLIRKSDGQIDWSLSAQQIERQIRAYLGWPGSYTELFDVRVTILSASLLPTDGKSGEHFISDAGQLAVYCGQGALEINELIPAGRTPMSSGDFLRGYSA